MEVSILNSEAAAHDNNNVTLANITTSQIQDLQDLPSVLKKKVSIPGRNDKIDRNSKGAVKTRK